MPDIKISQLPQITNAQVHAGDSFPLVDSVAGELKQMTMGQLDLRYTGVPDGGTTNQVLAKASGTNKDVFWKSLDKAAVGLTNVDNTSDANKPISNATQTALNLKANASALTTKADISYVNSQVATKQDALGSGTDGYVLTLVSGVPTWSPSSGGPGSVTSVFGRSGNVTAQVGDYDKTMIGLDQVDNTSDLDKPISTLTQTALNGKQASLPAGTNGYVLAYIGGNPTWVVKTPLTTKGDLYTFSTVEARLGVGANGLILMADSSTATGLKWAPAPSGLPAIVPTTDQLKILQVNVADTPEWVLKYFVPVGGTTGQVLSKNSATDGDLAWTTIDPGLAVSATQSLANAATAILPAGKRKRIKISGSTANAVVTIPNGTADGEELYIQGMSDANPVIIANAGNVISNGNTTYTVGVLRGHIWDGTSWIQMGSN